MNKTILIPLLAKAKLSEPHFILRLQAEVSKRFYPSKAGSSKVRGVGTFFITCSN
jgi:hypothetical protein